MTVGEAGGGIFIDFQHEVYQAFPDATIELSILVDGDDSTDDLEAVANGLFSFGAQVMFDAAKAEADSVSVVDQLNFLGFDDGAEVALDPGFAAAKGNIDVASRTAYHGNLLMTVTLINRAPAADSYALGVDFYRTLGPQERLFLNGNGEPLDLDISFGSAIVRVIPEPASWILIVSVFGLYWPYRTRRCKARTEQ